MNGKETSGAKLLAKARKGVHKQIEALATEVDEVTRRGTFEAMLGRMSRLWRYSFHNQWLIVSQRPGALDVKGRGQWEKAGRTVRENEAPIFIYQPGSDRGWPFLVGRVFDVLQTEGPDGAPSLIQEAEQWLGQVEAAAGRLGLTIEIQRGNPLEWGVLIGRATPTYVHIHTGLAVHERINVLCHEYAHVLLHLQPDTKKPPKPIRELEAEACAHVVCKSLGVFESQGIGTSAEYIHGQGVAGNELLLSLRRIAAASKAILTAIEGRKPRPRIPAWKPQPVEDVALAG